MMREPLLGYGPQGFALDVSPWQTKSSLEAAFLHRGVVVGAWAAVETNLIELSIRASRLDCYVKLRSKYPTRLKDRIRFLRLVADDEGPLKPWASLLHKVLDRYERSSEIRNIMAHAHMEVLPDWGATFSGYQAKGETEIMHYRQRLLPDELRLAAAKAARFSRAVFRIKRALDNRSILPQLEG